MKPGQQGCSVLLHSEYEHSAEPAQPSLRHQRLGRALLAISLAAGGAIAVESSGALGSSPAYGLTTFANDYPDAAMPCEHAPYAVSGACSDYDWGPLHTEKIGDPSTISSRGYGYRNCTDGVAYWVSRYIGPDIRGWSNANKWDSAAAGAKYTVYNGDTNNIEPGDIAQSDDGTFGHVGFVISVTKNTDGTIHSFSTAEMNRGGQGEYSEHTYSTRDTDGNFNRGGSKEWEHFIDINGPGKGLGNDALNPPSSSASPSASVSPPPTQYLVANVGDTVYAKQSLTDELTLEASSTNDVQAAGTRIGFLDSSGTLWVKDGLASGWRQEIGNVTSYALTSDMLVSDVGGEMYAKAAPQDMWTDIGGSAACVMAAGTRIVMVDNSGNLWAKDGLGGSWTEETGQTDQIAVTPQLLAIRVGGTIYAKAALADQWTVEVGGGATTLKASGNRIAFVDSNGTLWAKDGVSGTWNNELGSVTDFAITPELLVADTGGDVYAKVSLADEWTYEGGGASDVQAVGNRLGLRDSAGNLWAKDGIGGSWYDQLGSVTAYQLTTTDGKEQ